jgi:sulfate permease, SulP family
MATPGDTRTGGLARLLPITAWLPGYRTSRLRGDGVGALTAWAIVVPESVAYAQIAGVPPQNAFYAAPVALVAYALFGSSRHLVVGATSAAAILSASTVAVVSPDPARAVALSAALAIIAGVILMVAGLLRAWHLLTQIDQWSLATLAVGLGAIAALLLLERLAPRVPASLVVLAAGIILSAMLDLESHGVEIVGVIPSAVPTLAIPDVSRHEVAALLGGGFGLALIVFAESFSIASRFAREHAYEVDADQEMVAMGAANAAAGLFRGFAVSGSASRTAVAVRGFLRTEPLQRYWRLDRRSFWVAAAALSGTLVFDLLPGLLIAVALSLVWFISAASRPRLAVLGRLPAAGRYADLADQPDAVTVPGLLLVRPDGPVFFANANPLRLGVLDLVRTTAPPPRVVVLDLSSSFRLSLPTLDTLAELHDVLHRRGVELWLARVRGTAMAELQTSGLADQLGPAHLHTTLDDAVDAFTAGERHTPPSGT